MRVEIGDCMVLLEEFSERKPQKAFIQEWTNAVHGEEGPSTVSKMSKILSVLSDGRWHMMTEIRDRAKLDDGQIQQVMEFLERYCFVDVDKSARKVILKKNSQKFLNSEI